MSALNYTSGPWKFSENGKIIHMEDLKIYYVAEVLDGISGPMIASAPEMFEILRRFNNKIEQMWSRTELRTNYDLRELHAMQLSSQIIIEQVRNPE